MRIKLHDLDANGRPMSEGGRIVEGPDPESIVRALRDDYAGFWGRKLSVDDYMREISENARRLNGINLPHDGETLADRTRKFITTLTEFEWISQENPKEIS